MENNAGGCSDALLVRKSASDLSNSLSEQGVEGLPPCIFFSTPISSFCNSACSYGSYLTLLLLKSSMNYLTQSDIRREKSADTGREKSGKKFTRFLEILWHQLTLTLKRRSLR